MMPTLFRAFVPRGAVSSHPRLPCVVTAIAVAAVSTQLACASAGGTRTKPAATPSAGDTSSSVRDIDGKTLDNLFTGRFPGVTVARAAGGGLQITIRGGSNTF